MLAGSNLAHRLHPFACVCVPHRHAAGLVKGCNRLAFRCGAHVPDGRAAVVERDASFACRGVDEEYAAFRIQYRQAAALRQKFEPTHEAVYRNSETLAQAWLQSPDVDD